MKKFFTCALLGLMLSFYSALSQTSISGAISIYSSCGQGCDASCNEASMYTIYAPQTACSGASSTGNCGGGSPGTHYSAYITVNIPSGCTATVTAEYGGPNNVTSNCSDSRMDAGGPDVVGISNGSAANPLPASYGSLSSPGGTTNIGTCSFGAGGSSGATLNGGAGSTGCYTSGGGGNSDVLCTKTGITGNTNVTIWGGMNRGDEIITYTVTATGASCPIGVIVLPIELISFVAYEDNAGIVLKWATSTELNNDYFAPEYSINGAEFVPFAQVKGAGNSYQKKEYTCRFNENTGGLMPYFRLRQVDFNGKSKFSPVIMLGTSYGAPMGRNGIKAWYDYSNQQVTTRFFMDDAQPATLRVLNTEGHVMYESETWYAAGDNTEKIAASLAPGVYFVQLFTENKQPGYCKLVVAGR